MLSRLFGSKKKQTASPSASSRRDKSELPTPREGRRTPGMEPRLTRRGAAEEVIHALDKEERERQRAVRELLNKLPASRNGK